MNKNVSLWRGLSSPPTITHIWIKDDGMAYWNKNNTWVPMLNEASETTSGLMSKSDKEVLNILVNNAKWEENDLFVKFSLSEGDFNLLYDNQPGEIYFRDNGIFVDGNQYSVTAPATEYKEGLVKLLNNFVIDGDGAILPPEGSGIAASPQLVFEALETAKDYIDEKLEGVQAPISLELNITNLNTGEHLIESLREGFIFSRDFEKDTQDKLYLSWIEL